MSTKTNRHHNPLLSKNPFMVVLPIMVSHIHLSVRFGSFTQTIIPIMWIKVTWLPLRILYIVLLDFL